MSYGFSRRVARVNLASFLTSASLRRLSLVATTVVLFAISYEVSKRPEARLGFLRRQLIASITDQAIRDLPKDGARRSIALLPIGGDEAEFIRRSIERKLIANGNYHIVDHSLLLKVLGELGQPLPIVLKLEDAD